MTSELAQYCAVGLGIDGQPIARVPGQSGWQVRDATGPGRPSLTMGANGAPGVVPFDATHAQLRRLVGNRFCILRLHPIDENGQLIDEAPPAQVTLDEVSDTSNSQEMLEMCRTLISFIESKDVLINQMSTALIQTNQNIHHDTADILRATTTMINVASGVERPELNIDLIADKVADRLEEEDEPSSRTPWFVQLLNGDWGKSMLGVAQEIALGIATAYKPKQ